MIKTFSAVIGGLLGGIAGPALPGLLISTHGCFDFGPLVIGLLIGAPVGALAGSFALFHFVGIWTDLGGDDVRPDA